MQPINNKHMSPFPLPVRSVGCGASRCGSKSDITDELNADIRAKVQDHPCYSEEAHHHFARMHVAVAPACNIQCNYCNRKYDCSNESRPGVVSEVLNPEQAASKTLAVAAAIPQLSVLGIAGPGDALANPARTLETFRRVREVLPDLKLCLSTNGLALPDWVDEIAAFGVDHVTITINCLDPDIGAQIYPWIFHANRRIFGREAAEILIAQQQKGLEMLVARGILVKVNSVMIPGINDEHLKEVSRTVRAKGAFLHNVMPLISDPVHGTVFGLSGQRGPSNAELEALQDACAGDMTMMRHCRQCRADAVGMLGEDRGDEFSMKRVAEQSIDLAEVQSRRARVKADILAELDEKRQQRLHAETLPENVVALQSVPERSGRPVRIAVASSGHGLINQHFGHAKEFLVYEVHDDNVRFISHRKASQYCSGDESCGDAETALGRTISSLEDCEILLCARIGIEPWGKLEAAGIQPNGEHAMEPIDSALVAVWKEMKAAGRLDSLPAQKRRA